MRTTNYKSVAAFAVFLLVAVLTLVIVLTASPLLTGDIRSLAALCALLLAETAAWLYVLRLLRGELRAAVAAFATFGYVVAAYWLGTIIAAFLVVLPTAFYMSIQALLFVAAALAGGILYMTNKHISGSERNDARRTADWNELLGGAEQARDKLRLWGEEERRILERELDQLVDLIRYSDPATLPELATVEYTLQIDLRLLTDKIESRGGQSAAEQAASVTDLRRSIIGLGNDIKQRNRQLAASKG